MTVQFNCPSCNALIAFDRKHCGKRARCLSCGQRFVIPSQDNETPQKIKPEPDEKGQPIPGFYRAAFAQSWRLFINPDNATGLVFVVASVCFKFFVGHTNYSFTMGAFRLYAPTGLIVTFAVWGCLFWYYMEIIYSTAFHEEALPEAYIGGLFGFIWNIVKSLYMFAVSLVIVEIPCIVFLAISANMGIELPAVAHTLAIAGLFAFPMAILTFAVGRDITIVARPDHILKPIAKAFWPYLAVVGLFVLTWELQMQTVGYGKLLGSTNTVVGLHLLANIAVQALALVAVRSIGLFHRHYNCHFPW